MPFSQGSPFWERSCGNFWKNSTAFTPLHPLSSSSHQHLPESRNFAQGFLLEVISFPGLCQRANGTSCRIYRPSKIRLSDSYSTFLSFHPAPSNLVESPTTRVCLSDKYAIVRTNLTYTKGFHPFTFRSSFQREASGVKSYFDVTEFQSLINQVSLSNRLYLNALDWLIPTFQSLLSQVYLSDESRKQKTGLLWLWMCFNPFFLRSTFQTPKISKSKIL